MLPSAALVLSWFVPVPIADNAVVVDPNGRHRFLTAAAPPGAGMNPGRALRCLFSTFLC